jgi:hypothetical protein
MSNKVIESQRSGAQLKRLQFTQEYAGLSRIAQAKRFGKKKMVDESQLSGPRSKLTGVLEDRRHFQRRHPRMF